jgi:hypothetical protein
MTVSVVEFVLERRPVFLMAALSSLAIVLYKLFIRVHFRPTLVAYRAKVRFATSKSHTVKNHSLTSTSPQAIGRKWWN